MTTSVGNNSYSRSFFEKIQNSLDPTSLIGQTPSFGISLKTEKYYLEHPILAATSCTTWRANSPEDHSAHSAWVKAKRSCCNSFVDTMDLDIQRNLAHLGLMTCTRN
ncbi:hypothetical protein Tco_0163841 [Tanacetum coccineum]